MAEIFIDLNRGNDSNPGTQEAPWASLLKIDDANYTAGDTIYLADDSDWYYDLSSRVLVPVGWTGTRARPVRITKYSPSSQSMGQKPQISWNRKILAREWVYNALNNAWTYTAPFNVGFLCLLRINNTWESSRTDAGIPLDSVDGRYWAQGTTLYLYAPSTVNPTEYYGEVLLSVTGVGFFTVSNNRQFVQFDNIRFKETGCGIFGYSDTAADVGIKVQEVHGETCSAIVTANTVGANGQLYIDIKEVTANNWGPAVIHGVSTNGAGFKQFDVFKCDIGPGLHSHSQGAVYCQVRSPGLRPRIFWNKFRNVNWGTKDKTDDGCAIYCETGSDNVLVYGNLVKDSYMAFQDGSGRSNTWLANVALNCKSFMRFGDGSGNNAMNLKVWNNTAVVGANIKATYGDGVPESGIRGYKDAGTITNIDIRNNLIYNISEAADYAAIITPQITPGASDYSNNAVFGNYTNVARREYTPFTVESTPNSITADPLVNPDFTLKGTSPLIEAGVRLGEYRDAKGGAYWNLPSIGAHEYERPRSSRV